MFLNHPAPKPTICAESEIAVRPVTYSKELGLSESQLDSIINEMKNWRETFSEEIATHKSLMKDLMDLYDERPIDKDKCNEKIDQITNHVNSFLKMYTDSVGKVSNELTEDQFSTLVQIYNDEKSILKPRDCGVI